MAETERVSPLVDEDREEPPLTLPPIRLPLDVRPIKVVRPLDFVLKDFKETNILPDLHIQENYMKFFKDSLGTLGEFINRGPAVGGLPGFGPDTGDNFLDTLLENINKEREQVEKAKEILTNPGLPAETRAQVEKYLKDTQEKLANSIRITTEHYAKGTSDKVRTGSGAVEVTQIITQGIGAVTNQETSGKLRTDLRAKYPEDTFYRRDAFRSDFAAYADQTLCVAQSLQQVIAVPCERGDGVRARRAGQGLVERGSVDDGHVHLSWQCRSRRSPCSASRSFCGVVWTNSAVRSSRPVPVRRCIGQASGPKSLDR